MLTKKTKDKEFMSSSLMVSAGILKTSAVVGKTISEQGYYNYLTGKIKSEMTMDSYAQESSEKSVAVAAAGQIADIVNKSKQITAQQTAVAASNGIDTGSNYLHYLAIDSAKQADKDISSVLYNASSLISKNRLEQKLKNVRQEAEIDSARLARNNALTAGIIGSVVSVFDTAGSVANKWLERQNR